MCRFPCPHSLTDKATAFEAVDGGSIPSGDTIRKPRHGGVLVFSRHQLIGNFLPLPDWYNI